MGISIGIFMVIIGAILAFAVTAETEGINLVMAGWILMIVGGIAAVLGTISSHGNPPDESR